GAVALAALAAAWRFGGVGRTFEQAPRLAIVTVMRVGAVLRGAVATLRAALAADVTLNPALVRVKTRARDPSDRAAFAGMISATPGMAVVETEPDGMLVHLTEEDAIDAEDLGELEAMLLAGRRT